MCVLPSLQGILKPVVGSLPSNLYAWYKGENNCLDSSGNNRHATAGIGTVPTHYAAGQVGQAFDFNTAPSAKNGSEVITTPVLNLGAAYSFEAWIQYTNANNQDFCIIGNNYTSAGNFGTLYLDFSTKKIEYWQNSVLKVQSATALSLNTWYKIKMTYDGSKVRFYIFDVISGTWVLDATESGTHAENFNSVVKIGHSVAGHSFDGVWQGKLDELKFYSAVV